MKERLARRLAAALLLAALVGGIAPRAGAHSPHDVIEAWAMSPAFPADRTLFVALPRFNLLLRSTDAGESWQSCVKGLETAYVTGVAISPEFGTDHTLWCAEIAGLFVSRDAGESWQKVALPAELRDIAGVVAGAGHDASGPGVPRLAIVSRKQGLWLSADGLAFERARGADVAAGVTALDGSLGLWGSTCFALANGGSGIVARDAAPGPCHLSRIAAMRGQRHGTPHSAQPVEGARVLATDGGAESPTVVVATRDAGVWLGWSTPEGLLVWSQEGELPAGASVLHLSVAHDADDARVLFAATADHGVLIRHGDGEWHASLDGFREPTHQTKEHWLGTMVSPGWATDRTVYACSFEGLYVSTDGGEHWRWLNTLHPQLVRNVALSPRFADDGALWLSTYGVGLQQSEDRGKTFTKVDTESWEFPDGIAVSRDWRPAGADAPAAGALLIGAPNNMLLSRDGGATVAPCLPGAKGFPRVLAFAPDWATSGIAFAHLSTDTGLKTNRFVRTADHGATWADTSVRTVYDLVCAPDWETSDRCWAACPDGLFRSDDRGVTFVKVDSLPAAGLNSVALAPGAPAPDGSTSLPCLAVVSLGRGLFLSRDGGATWSAPGNPPARPAFVRLSPDFARDGLLFAGTHTDGLWTSHDAGAHWARSEGGPRMVLCLEISPTFAADHTLVVGAYEQPWITSDAGASWRAIELPIPAGYVPEASREGDVDAALPPAPHKSGG